MVGRDILFGCIRSCLEADTRTEEGKVIEAWFDEQRLTGDSPAATGGPQAMPPKRSTG